MTHLHFPDGVIPWPWIGAGLAAAALLVWLASRGLARHEAAARVPRAAVLSALMVLGQSVPLGFIPFHLNLTVLAGILLGPRLSILAGLAVNLILALMGHGGLTVVGLNTVVTSAEMLLGYALFALLRPRLSAALGAGAATAAALALSFALIVGVAGLAGGEYGALLDEDEHAVAHQTEAAGGLTPFLAVAAPVFGTGVVIEAAVAATIAGYLGRVRPDLLPR